MPHLRCLPLTIAAAGGLHAIDYGIVILYLLGTFAAGYYFSRQQHEGDDYFVGGRRMPWFAVGLSIAASLMSVNSYLGTPGEVLQHGLALTCAWLAIPIAYAIITFVWIPFLMRLGVTSIYEYLEWRFGLVARWLAVGMFVLVLRFFWMATIVVTGAIAVAHITYDSLGQVLPWQFTLDEWTVIVLLTIGISTTIYTTMGGIQGDIWTDVVQFVILFAGLIVTLAVIAIATDTGPLDWWRNTASSAADRGHSLPPLASWDITQRNTILFTILHVVFWYICTFLGDQVAVQRFLSTPSVRAAARSNLVNMVCEMSANVFLAMCGMALLTYFLDPRFHTDIIQGIADPRDPAAAERVFPYFIAHSLPIGLSGLVVSALLAAGMSSLDSGVNSIATVLTIDIFGRLNPELTKTGELKLARRFSVAVGAMSTFLALAIFTIVDDYDIIGIGARTFNCALGPLAAMFFIGMFIPRAGQRSVVIAACLGLVVAVVSAWYAETLWLLGLTAYPTLEAAREHLRGPSLFLITPIAATVTVLGAQVISLFMPASDPSRGQRYSWRQIVRTQQTAVR